MSESSLLIVTPEQFQAGYTEFINGVLIHRSWNLYRKLEDGNYIVQVPQRREQGGPQHG